MSLKLKDFRNFFQKNWQEIVLVLSFFLYFLYFSGASFLRYIHFYTGRFDLGNMDQTVWNTINGNLFSLTDPNGTAEISRLAVHADFILVLLSPLYLIWSDPRMLLLVQTLVLSLGGIFVFLIAKKVLKNKTISLAFAIAFYLNPLVQFTNLYDFHAVTLATTFLLAAFYFILEKKWLFVLFFLFLAGITKEQVWATNALLGLYIIFISKEKIIGGLVTFLSSFMFIFLFWFAIPNAALENQHFALSFFDKYGTSPHEIIKNIILNPIEVLKDMLTPDKQKYLQQLFRPLGYLSILGLPILIFALPDLAINLLSSFTPMHQIWYQYTSTITPFIFIAGIFGVKYLIKFFPNIKHWYVTIFILIFAFHTASTYGPLWFSDDKNDAWYKKPLENRNEINNYLETIPLEAKVSASNTVGSHMSQRREIYVIPMGIENSDFVIFLLRKKHGKEFEAFEKILKNDEYELHFENGDFYSFKRTNLN